MWDPFADPADDYGGEGTVNGRAAGEADGKAAAVLGSSADAVDVCKDFGASLEPWEDPGLEAISSTIGEALQEAKVRAEKQDAQQIELFTSQFAGPPIVGADPSDAYILRSTARAAKFDEIEVFSDVTYQGEFRELVLQARALSEACFESRFSLKDLSVERHLTLLVNTVLIATCGYCIYSVAPQDAALVIEELAVAQVLRGTGFGKCLLQWVVSTAVTLQCRAVQLQCAQDVQGFFQAFGFEVMESWLPAGQPYLELQLTGSHQGLGSCVAPLGSVKAGGSDRVPWLVCFLASHVSSHERLSRFAETLASIARQEPEGPPELFLSWSATSPELRDRTQKLLASCGIESLHSIEQETKHSQFQHLAACFRAAGSRLRAGGWAIFADDDDLWHPRRYAEYLGIVDLVHKNTAVWTIAATSHAMLRRSVVPRATTPKDVDRLLAQGPNVCFLSDAELLYSGPQDAAGQLEHGLPEYFDVAVRGEQLRNFFLRTPQKILANKFCDRRFVNQFLGRKGVHWFRPVGWLYFYSRADGITRVEAGDYSGGASFGIEVSEADVELVTELESLRPDGSVLEDPDGAHPLSILPKDDIAFLAASTRAAIQELVISLGSLEKGSVSSLDLEAVCGRAFQDRSNICEFPGATEELWHWADSLARRLGAEVCKTLGVRVLG